MNSDPIINAENITKRYGSVAALDGANLTVEAGQVHGFLGPNGAGKSTAIRAILGHLALTSGTLEVFGMHPQSDAVPIHRRLAYVPGDVSLWPALSGGECLDLLGRMHGHQNRERRDHLIEKFNLDPSKKSRTYSKGNRQKVALIAALALDVELYIFDEPTTGLDPLMEATFQREVRALSGRGATVLLSSHILDEVEALCSHVTILRAGKTISSGPFEALRQHTTTTISATFAIGSPTESLERVLAQLGAEADVSTDSQGVHVTARADRAHVAPVTAEVASASPQSLVVRPPSLDELFLEHYAESKQ